MMNKGVLIIAFLSFFSTNLFSQLLGDAVRFSQQTVGGTARSVGIGGAIGALGADFSVLSTNPAGAAAFRRSEFTFTPSFDLVSSDAQLIVGDNETVKDNKLNFNFNNIGVVFSGSPLSRKWRTAAFGIGINRLANYHENIAYEGTSNGSITDRWLELAGNLDPSQFDQFEAGLAWETFALDFDNNGVLISDFNNAETGYQAGTFLVDKSQQIKRKGSINELVFTYAGNFDEKFMIGATLGVPILNYEETKVYMETDESDRVPLFEELEFTETLTTKGSGINLKLGMIYKISQAVRVGAAVHSPTSYGLEDVYSTGLSYRFAPGGVSERREEESLESTFEYRMRSPWRFIGSGGFIIKKQGFISAEVEYVDYTNAKFNFNSTSDQNDIAREDAVNTEINTQLASALNIRLGGEYALDMFRLRAGYTLNTSPYLDIAEKNGSVSLGAGYRGEDFFIDLAYKRLTSKSEYRPYLLSLQNIDLEQPVGIDGNRNRVLITLGFKL